MDFDINNQTMLEAGAIWRVAGIEQHGWSSMASAPRDGTVIEVRNSYGIAPTYSLAKWTTESTANSNEGRVSYILSAPEWVDTVNGGGWISELALNWRPYSGDITKYIDPTGGAQDSPAYWRGAIASKYGLPLNHFETQVAKNIGQKKKGFLAWLFD